jgi:hypothetical protein
MDHVGRPARVEHTLTQQVMDLYRAPEVEAVVVATGEAVAENGDEGG